MFLFWYGVAFMVGVLLGTTTMYVFFCGEKEKEVNYIIGHYMEREAFMQRYYQVSQQVEYEDPKKRVEEIRKMVGCYGCTGTLPPEDTE